MTRARLMIRRARWAARERYRHARYRRAITREARPGATRADHAARERWARLYRDARDHRRALDQFLARTVAHVSDHGINFITEREGVVLHPYVDSAGHATIGVGHLIHLGPVTAADRARYEGFTLADARTLLAEDLDVAEHVVRDAFAGAELLPTHNRFDAAVSLAFNVGAAGFASSTVARLIRTGDERGAADAFLLWDRPPELLGRRKLERELFLQA